VHQDPLRLSECEEQDMKSFGAASKIVTAVIASCVALASASAQTAPPKQPSGSVQFKSVQAGFIGSASAGGGVLRFRGKSYKFSTGGLGVGGMGVSKLTASGSVYNLNTPGDFEGVYGQIRTGWALGDHGRGRIWLQNPKGVLLKLTARREGLATATGIDGVAISFAR
jgi:hypothetical protein